MAAASSTFAFVAYCLKGSFADCIVVGIGNWNWGLFNLNAMHPKRRIATSNCYCFTVSITYAAHSLSAL